LQNGCPLLIERTLLVDLILQISKMSLPRAKADRGPDYDQRNRKFRNQIQPIPDRFSAHPRPIEKSVLLAPRRRGKR
jgi:hypothetical protein